MKTNYGFSRRGPDQVTDEIATVLSSKRAYEFLPLFLVVHDNLKARNAARGGEEMLRLRAYEKLQNLIHAGVVTKSGREYKGVFPALPNFQAAAAEADAKLAFSARTRPLPVAPAAPRPRKSAARKA